MITEYCHPADLVPLMRELKELSVSDTVTGSRRAVDLLFRACSKSEGYVWVESRGRLHVEPGKGRKAIILNGRVRPMPVLRWGDAVRVGGVVPAVGGVELVERFLVGSGIRDVLGWAVAETIGKLVFFLVVDEGSGRRVIEEWTNRGGDEILKVKCEMVGNDGQRRPVEIVLYRSRERSSAPSIIIQVKTWGLLPLRISPTRTIKTYLKNWIRAAGRVGNTSYSSSSLPIRGYTRSSRRSSRTDFENKRLRLLSLNVHDKFYPLRGSVAVTAIWVRHLNCASMRDNDLLNVLGGRYEQFGCFHGRYYSITCTIVCFLSSSPIHE